MATWKIQPRAPLGPALVAATVILSTLSAADAQQATIQAPLRTVNESFFEHIGASWSLGGRNGFFRFGGGPALPPFGGATPGAGITGGAGINGNGVNGGLAFTAGQGSRRSNVMQSGNLTLYNGYPGVVADTSQSPFVIGIIPVVGDGKVPWQQQMKGEVPKQIPGSDPPEIPPSESDRLTPAAKRNDPGLFSLDELRQQKAAADAARDQEARQHLAKAREAQTAGKTKLAKVYYQMAARRADAALKDQIAAELAKLDAQSPNP